MRELILYLSSIHPVSAKLQEYLLSILKTKILSKKSYLLKAGQICNHIYFIEKGLVRCFYVEGEKEVCSWFMKEADVIISVESFYLQKPSYESIQALEDCILHYIDYNELQFIYHNYIEFNFIGRVLTEKYYTLSEQRLYSLRMRKAPERYALLLHNFPELIQRVSSTHLASYLGLSLETFSRIKSKV
ncbi:MAG: Crp/Fnr family transcriptional regulator [Chitinophagaceae bacterium]